MEDFFNGLGQLTQEYQSQDGAVDLDSTPPVTYSYTEMSGGQNNSRLISITYPSAYQVDYNYDSGLDSDISRLSSISDNSGILESYVYLGVGTVVEWDHPQTGVEETYLSQNGSTGAAGDELTGLDQFGRIVDDAYINAVTGQYTDEFLYTYDRDGNALTMTNALYTSYSQSYSYNGLNELTGFTQPNYPSLSYSYDALGNITDVSDLDGAGTRTSNAQNEYTSVESGSGTPTYDSNGNLATDPTTGNQFTYNAWNELVSVSNGGTVLGYFQYDALGRMDVQTVSGTTTDLYYNTQGQIIEQWVGSQASAQNVWCPLGTNKLVCENYDPVDGAMTGRVYVQQDAIGNVMSLVSTSATVLDRWSYTPFGQSNEYELSTPLAPMPYGFQCMFTYGSLGIAQAGACIYDFSLQVFAQMDPIGMNDGSADGYIFTDNDPVNYTDPTGLAPLDNIGVNSASPLNNWSPYEAHEQSPLLTSYWGNQQPTAAPPPLPSPYLGTAPLSTYPLLQPTPREALSIYADFTPASYADFQPPSSYASWQGPLFSPRFSGGQIANLQYEDTFPLGNVTISLPEPQFIYGVAPIALPLSPAGSLLGALGNRLGLGGLAIAVGTLMTPRMDAPCSGNVHMAQPRRLATGKDAFKRAVKELGLDENAASQELHDIKEAAGRGPADNVAIDLNTGDVIAPESGEVIGNLLP